MPLSEAFVFPSHLPLLPQPLSLPPLRRHLSQYIGLRPGRVIVALYAGWKKWYL